MIKTQVYLAEADYSELRKEAYETKQTMSEIVRNLIRKELISQKPVPKRKRKNAGEALLELAKKYSFKGPKDLATNLDHYLYGAPKKK